MNKIETTILFLCTGNSCRSQMAEGWARHLKDDGIEAFSAGIEKHGLNPDAVEVMAEASSEEQRLKPYRRVRDEIRDYIETLLQSLRS